MADVIDGQGAGTPGGEPTPPEPTGGESLLGGEGGEPTPPEPPEGEPPEGGSEGEPPEPTEGEPTPPEPLEINLDDYKGVVDTEVVGGLIEKVNKGEMTTQELITEFLNKEKETYESELKTSQEIVDSIKTTPPKGVDLVELNKWVFSKGDDFAKIVGTLVNTSNGEEVMRAGIELVNKLRMDSVKGVPNGTQPTQPQGTKALSEEKFMSEYERIHMGVNGENRVNELMKLKQQYLESGNEELIELANAMIGRLI